MLSSTFITSMILLVAVPLLGRKLTALWCPACVHVKPARCLALSLFLSPHSPHTKNGQFRTHAKTHRCFGYINLMFFIAATTLFHWGDIRWWCFFKLWPLSSSDSFTGGVRDSSIMPLKHYDDSFIYQVDYNLNDRWCCEKKMLTLLWWQKMTTCMSELLRGSKKWLLRWG